VQQTCVERDVHQRRLDALAAMATAAGAGLLATTDARFHHPSRRRLADVLAAIRLGTTVDALGYAAEPNAERHLKPPAEMARLFARHPDALANTLRVLDIARSGFSLDALRYEYPEEVLEPGRTPQQTLEARVAAAVAERWPGGAPPDIRARLAHELALIDRLSYAPYFLTVHEVVAFARGRGILCQGRGSAANPSRPARCSRTTSCRCRPTSRPSPSSATRSRARARSPSPATSACNTRRRSSWPTSCARRWRRR
jgi:error-prone DNA polymerase